MAVLLLAANTGLLRHQQILKMILFLVVVVVVFPSSVSAFYSQTGVEGFFFKKYINFSKDVLLYLYPAVGFLKSVLHVNKPTWDENA